MLLAWPGGARAAAKDAGGAPAGEALFRSVFGASPQPRSRRVPVRFELDTGGAGWLHAMLGGPAAADGAVRLEAAPLLEALKQSLREAEHGALQEAVDAQGLVSTADLKAAGLEAAFDPARLEVRVGVPPQLRRTTESSLGQEARIPEDAVRAGRVSGFLNLRAAQDLSVAPGAAGLPSTAAPARLPFRLGLEGALNVEGWVLEGRGGLSEDPSAPWDVRDVRLVRDFPASALRVTAGDFGPPARLLGASRRLLGVNVSRDAALDPSRQRLPSESLSFFLERPSRVEVLVNGQQVRSLQLPAGPHDLRGLALDPGPNALELVITDDVGGQQRMTRRAGLANTQLAAGLDQFSLSAGVPQDALAPATGLGALTGFAWTSPAVHAAYRYGVDPRLTLGAELSADAGAQAAALEGVWATFYGNLGATGSLSRAPADGAPAGALAWAGQVQYELQTRGEGVVQRSVFTLTGGYRSGGFRQPGAAPLDAVPPDAAAPSAVSVGAQLGNSFADGFYTRLSGEARLEGAEQRATARTGLTLGKSWRSGLGVMADVSHQMRPAPAAGGPGGPGGGGAAAHALSGRLSLTWAWPEQRRSVALSAETGPAGPSGQVSAQQSVTALRGQVDASAQASYSAGGQGLQDGLRYRGARAQVELNHRTGWQEGFGRSTGHVMEARLGTALVFADGMLAWSRPVTGSFAVVAPHEALRGQRIGVNPSALGDGASIDGLGPAVVPDLQPYALSAVRLDTAEVPVGYSVGTGSYSVVPAYRSGSLIRVGEAGSTFARGWLLDAAGQPVAVSSGMVLPEAGGGTPKFVFTNRTGRFALGGLEPGRYTLAVDDSPLRFVLEVPEAHEGLLDLGRLRPVGAPALPTAVASATPAPKPGVAPAPAALALGPDEVAVELPGGPARAKRLEQARFPLAVWAAGVPLSEEESQSIEALAQKVFADKALRLLVVAHVQTTGQRPGVEKLATRGGNALKRYLMGVQQVPGSRVLTRVQLPEAGVQDPLGHIELVLVRLEAPP
jgi:outer membrane usher protein